MLTRKQLLAGAITGAGGYLASGALGGGKGHGWGTTHKLGRTTTTTTTGPHDTTSFIDDIGIIATGTYLSAANPTNLNKYASIFIGPSGVVESQPGQTIRHSTFMWSENDTIAPSIATATTNGWLVHDNAGNPVPFGSSDVLNVGHVGYQNSIKTNALSFLASNPGTDGIWFDGFGISMDNFTATAYPFKDQANNVIWNNDADFQSSQIAAITNIGAAIKAAGYQVQVNGRGLSGGPDGLSNDGTRTKDWMDRYYPYVTGTTAEYWIVDSGGTPNLNGTGIWHYDDWTEVARHAYGLGITFNPISYRDAGEHSQTRYIRAAFLMDVPAGTARNYCYHGTRTTVNVDIWNAEMAVDPGQPQSAKVAVGSCWKRQFERNLIYINPTASTQTPDGHSIASGDALFL